MAPYQSLVFPEFCMAFFITYFQMSEIKRERDSLLSNNQWLRSPYIVGSESFEI
ncbi:hypothetical protein AusDCA_3255 [Desulfitobacterium sp. AusDCA]